MSFNFFSSLKFQKCLLFFLPTPNFLSSFLFGAVASQSSDSALREEQSRRTAQGELPRHEKSFHHLLAEPLLFPIAISVDSKLLWGCEQKEIKGVSRGGSGGHWRWWISGERVRGLECRDGRPERGGDVIESTEESRDRNHQKEGWRVHLGYCSKSMSSIPFFVSPSPYKAWLW